MNCLKRLYNVIILSAAFFLSCGIEESYYLPQVPESYITRSNNTGAEIILPNINDPQYYYATHYSIFYRIYMSDNSIDGEIQTSSDRSNISPNLANDFNFLEPITDPTNKTAITSSTTFSGRFYYELELDGAEIGNILSTNGGTFRIRFPTMTGDIPVLILVDEQEIQLRRSRQLISPLPTDDPSFRNSAELNDSVNTDVVTRTSGAFAYVSMYIVTVGYNNALFTQMYSKPTHINIFRLPDAN